MFSDNKALHLGKIYHLIEQFELISRTDLAKLSGLAPASVTNLTKILIDNHFILERTVQTTLSRGRPSVGLAVSNFFGNYFVLLFHLMKLKFHFVNSMVQKFISKIIQSQQKIILG